jgi:hypothetical protein
MTTPALLVQVLASKAASVLISTHSSSGRFHYTTRTGFPGLAGIFNKAKSSSMVEIYLVVAPGSQTLQPWRRTFLLVHSVHAPQTSIAAVVEEHTPTQRMSVAHDNGCKFGITTLESFLTSHHNLFATEHQKFP